MSCLETLSPPPTAVLPPLSQCCGEHPTVEAFSSVVSPPHSRFGTVRSVGTRHEEEGSRLRVLGLQGGHWSLLDFLVGPGGGLATEQGTTHSLGP